MTHSRTLEEYNHMPVQTAVIKNALPAVAAMLMTLIYNLADTFFIGRTNDACQTAAVSLATPVFLLFMSLGNIFGIGGTSVISRAYGEGRKEYANKVGAFCMWSSIGTGLLLMALMLLFLDPLLKLIGASTGTWEYTKTYLFIVSFSGPFSLVSSAFSNILRAEGQAARAMAGQIVGNLTNMVLDAVFIIGCGWGIAGCALATLIGEILGAFYYLFYYISGKSSLKVGIRHFTVHESVASSTFAVGIPAALGSILMSVSQILMNHLMTSYGDMAVAGVGVAMKINMITGMIAMGIGQGIQPLLGYCTGSKEWDRFRKYMKFCILFSFLISAVLTLLCFLFTGQLVDLFLSNTAAASYAVKFSRILISSGPICGIFFVLLYALQAMGAGTASLVINTTRQGLLYIPMLYLMNAVFGSLGLIWTQPIVDLISLFLVTWFYIQTCRKRFKNSYRTFPPSLPS